MEIKKIITNRKIDPHHANALLYEWEDDLCSATGATLHYNRPCQNKRYSKFIPFLLNFVQTSEPAFAYEMCVYRHSGNNRRNIIPCILDYYIHDPVLAKLWSLLYWRNPIICVSSPEVHEFLHDTVGLGKVRLMPLTLSNRYRLEDEAEPLKRYDMFLAGRQNPVLYRWFEQYRTSHPGTTFVCSRRLPNDEFRFFDQNGNRLSDDDSRETYMSFMRASRACMYSPQGVDGSRQTNGFSQVTPKFLEIIACGCHPLLRFKSNPDSDFFQLESFCPHIASYEQFEILFDEARTAPVDLQKHRTYMQDHYTSTTADILERLASSLNSTCRK